MMAWTPDVVIVVLIAAFVLYEGRRVGRGRHSEFDPGKSVAALEAKIREAHREGKHALLEPDAATTIGRRIKDRCG
jgi:hypothetical protein